MLNTVNFLSLCRCVYGKVEELTIQIPWTNPYSRPTHIEITGLYMLMVPTTSIGYDKVKEEKAEQEAKMAKISAIEEAKQRDKLFSQKKEDGDTFVQKLFANILKNLKVKITKIHIRYEDKQTNSESFGAGLTLDSLEIWTNKENKESESKQMSFNKLVQISSFGVYWQPRERVLYSEAQNFQEDNVRDDLFRRNIARSQL